MTASSVPLPLWKNRDYLLLALCGWLAGMALLTTLNAHVRRAPALAEAAAA